MTINNYPTGWQDAWHEKLAAMRAQFPNAHIYALIEGVLNEACYPLLKRSRNLPFYALYANTPSADEETLCVSPLVIEYTESARHTWESLLKKTNGLPALSLIVTSDSLAQLTERLTPWCVVDAAGHTLALSFADTRILPELFKVLTPHQLAQFCGPALQWQYLTRSATWQELSLPTTAEEMKLAPADAVILDDAQCAQLMAASEPDNVLFQLRRISSNLIESHSPARAYEIVRYWLECANHAQMEGAPERFNLCEMGLTHLHLMNSPPVAAWLAEASQPHAYDALYARWVNTETV